MSAPEPEDSAASTSLFRQQALDAQQTSRLGRIVLVNPPSAFWVTAIAVLLGLLLIALFTLGSYTRRSTVSGQLMPGEGLAQVFPAQAGTIAELHVQEGQRVQKGDLLYVISSERTSEKGGGVQAAISEQVTARLDLLQGETGQIRQLHRDAIKRQSDQVASLARELEQLDTQITEQKKRVDLARRGLDRYRELAGKGFVSQDQLQGQQEALLDQESRLNTLQRERTTLQTTHRQQAAELALLPTRQQAELSQLQRQLNQTRQELTESEAQRSLRVLAPRAGTVTNILLDVGQMAEPERPLLAIVPEDSPLEAQLYVSSAAIGFVRPGQPVLLRYQAYPYQKFGQAEGTVRQVSRTALGPAEFASRPLGWQPATSNNEPVYRITVQLARQTLRAYGEEQPLQPGMLLEADIMQEQRRLYEWVLEPLYTVSGRL
ncbi:MAG: HlyD family efflux transporter periplasmic adaptor subunit [Moraxellaceae bacterium]|nr:HlyD family efflux transporter periplasmic adaptor subunit [Moraxellaceae bacterium]